MPIDDTEKQEVIEEGQGIVEEEAQPVEMETVVVDDDDREDLSGLTGLSEEEHNHLFGLSGTVGTGQEDDLSDLVDVPEEAIMGTPPGEEMPVRRVKLVPKVRRVVRVVNPPATMGGMK